MQATRRPGSRANQYDCHAAFRRPAMLGWATLIRAGKGILHASCVALLSDTKSNIWPGTYRVLYLSQSRQFEVPEQPAIRPSVGRLAK